MVIKSHKVHKVYKVRKVFKAHPKRRVLLSKGDVYFFLLSFTF